MKSFFTKINKFLNVFLVFFNWIILIPVLEISSGFLYCTDYSYILTYVDDCENYPTRYVIISSLGIACTYVIGTLITILYRNYEFNESELMKRKFSSIYLV